MSEPLTYARAPQGGADSGAPWDWFNVEVIDLDTGEKLNGVIEVNAAEGWLVRYARTANGDLKLDPTGEYLVSERVEGRFELRRREQAC